MLFTSSFISKDYPGLLLFETWIGLTQIWVKKFPMSVKKSFKKMIFGVPSMFKTKGMCFITFCLAFNF